MSVSYYVCCESCFSFPSPAPEFFKERSMRMNYSKEMVVCPECDAHVSVEQVDRADSNRLSGYFDTPCLDRLVQMPCCGKMVLTSEVIITTLKDIWNRQNLEK
jgi:hypothetical protein